MINFKQLLHKKPEHPMASLEGARKVLATLPADNPLRALEGLSFWLGSLHDAEVGELSGRIAVIRLLDDAAQPFQRVLGRDYLAATRVNKSQENQQWTALFEFWKRLTDSYFLCLEWIEKGVKGGEPLQTEMAALSVRTMQALGMQTKLRHWRYLPADERVWSDIGKLRLLAERKGFVNTPVLTCLASQKATSMQQELLKILMLEAAAPDRLLPVQIELVDRLVGQFSDSFELGHEPGECAHYLDLSARKPPARLLPGGRTHSLMRFFGAGTALAGLQEMLRQVKLSAGPQELVGEGASEKNELLDLLHQLLQRWSAMPPQRKHQRKTVVSRLNVVHGMAEIRQRLAMPVSKAPAWMGGEESGGGQERVESWVMENISESGLGAIVPELAEDWVRVGALLGLRPEGGREWSVGVVRRLKRTPRMEIYVGIEILSHEPELVHLQPVALKLVVSDNVTELGRHDNVPALLLSFSPGKLGSGALLLEPGACLPGTDYRLLRHDEQLPVCLDGIVEQGKDYEQADFSLASKAVTKL